MEPVKVQFKMAPDLSLYERPVKPPPLNDDTFDVVPVSHNGSVKSLREMPPIKAEVEYQDHVARDLLDLLHVDQEITFSYVPPPFFIMSPRIKLRWAKDYWSVKTRGRLSDFQPDAGLDEEGNPQASIQLTITPTNSVPEVD